MFDCRTIDDLDSESESNVIGQVVMATVVVDVVVVVATVVVVVVVVVCAVTVILDCPFMVLGPMLEGPPSGPKILPNHCPVGASGAIRKRNV